MNKFVLFNVLASVMIIMGSCGGNKPNYNARLKTDVDSASFYLGYNYGAMFHQWDFEDVNLNAFATGMLQAIKKGAAVDETVLMEAQMFLEEFSVMLHGRASEKNLKEGNDFLEANKRKQGVITLQSGLQYKIIREGDGNVPDMDDMVEVHYHGTLIDGTVFESSKTHGMPAQFNVGDVIPGFSEALSLMNEGSVWEVYIPYELGYGAHGSQSIRPNSVIIFELELLRIIRNDE